MRIKGQGHRSEWKIAYYLETKWDISVNHVTLYVLLEPYPNSYMCPETPGSLARTVGLLTWAAAQVGDREWRLSMKQPIL